MAILKNRAGVATSTVGTGPITLGVALTSATQPNAASWQTFAAAGVANGDRVRYLILDSNGSWEYGEAVYTATGTVLARASGAMDGSVPGQKSSTGALLALTGTAQVFITAVAEDLSRVVFTAVSSVNQTGIVTETFTKVNFGSVGINDGSYYNAGTSRWIPPAGRCQLEASISANNVLLGTPIILGFNKNGASYRSSISAAVHSGGMAGAQCSVIDTCNGTDFYEVVAWMHTGSTANIPPGESTFFQGATL